MIDRDLREVGSNPSHLSKLGVTAYRSPLSQVTC
jgi:hypothetical protein